MNSQANHGRVAVLVRTHFKSDKVLDLLQQLSGRPEFDLFVVANETHGAIDFAPFPKISCVADEFRKLGFDMSDETFFVHCSDLLFSVVKRHAPGYSHYVMLEYDVHFTRSGGAFLASLAAMLIGPEHAHLDLVATRYRRCWDNWIWYRACHNRYDEVYGIFFPLVGLSARAIDALLGERLAETELHPAASLRPFEYGENDIVYCEAFVPSALSALGGYHIADLNSLFPGCYEEASFTIGVPHLMGEIEGDGVEMVHPVYGPREYLERALSSARRDGTLGAFVEELRGSPSVVLAEYKEEFLGRARGLLQDA